MYLQSMVAVIKIFFNKHYHAGPCIDKQDFHFHHKFSYFLPKSTVMNKSTQVVPALVPVKQKNRYTVLMLLCITFAFTMNAGAQNASQYSFSTVSNASLALDKNSNAVDLSTSTQLVASTSDDVVSASTNIGFNFTFFGTTYTAFTASSNGGIRLGGTIGTTTIGTSFPVSAQAILAPYLGDIRTSTTGKVHYKLIGTAPNRSLVIEFLNMGINFNNSTANGTFQVRLYEQTGVIEYVYGAMSVGSTSTTSSTTANARTVVIGFSNTTGANNQFSVNQSTYATSITATAITNTNAATGAIAGLNSAANGSRRSFTFTPTLPYRAQFISLNAGSATWCAGETRNVTIQIKNIGTSSWTDGGGNDFNIGVKWNTNAANWADYFVRVDAQNLAAGATGTFVLPITASNATVGPVYGTALAAGTNNLTFDIVWEGVTWFGANGGSVGPGNAAYTSPNQTISALPTITKGANPAVCQGTTSANLTYSATTGTPNQYSIDYDAAANLAGFIDVVNATLPATPIIMVVPAGAAAATYNGSLTVTNSTTGCSSTAQAIAVTVNPSPSVTPGTSPVVCRGTTSALLSYTAAGSPNQYSIDYDPTANANGFVDITNASLPVGNITIVIPSGAPADVYNAVITVRNSTSGCTSTGAPVTVTLNAPSVSFTGPTTLCINDVTSLFPTSGGTWISNSPAVASVNNAGDVTALSAGSATFTFTETATGCSSTTGSITVNGNATLTLTSAGATTAQTKCINNAITIITYQVAGSGTGATVTGLPTGVTGSYNSGTKVFTISGTPTLAGSFNYSVTTSGPCVNPSLGGTIDVTAASAITLTSGAGTNTQTKCINNAITNITYDMSGTATAVSITAGALPAGVTGSFDGISTFTIAGAPTVAGTFNYTVSTAGPCPLSLTGTITVTANSTISLSSPAGTDAQTKCISTPITNITYAVGGSGTGATVSGLPAGVTGAYSAGTFTISGSPSAAGTFSYTVTTTGPCVNPSLGGTITVTPNATLVLASGNTAQTTCENTAITNIVYTVGASGTGATVSGLPAGVTGAFSAGSFTISGTPTVAGSFAYTVTTTGPCVNPSLGGTIVVNPQPTAVSITPAAATICVGSSQALTGSASIGSLSLPSENFNAGNSYTAAGTLSGNRTQIFESEVSGVTVNSITAFTNGSGNVIASTVGSSSTITSETVATTLTSPVFSAAGVTLTTLTFNHTYKQGNSGSPSGKVEISTNGGTSWTTLATYTTNQGAVAAFGAVSLNISAYSNTANLRLRFNFTSGITNFFSNNTAWWAIDDVVLNGTLPAILYSWIADTAPGVNGLPVNAGTPLAGNSSISVNPTATTTYTLTAQNPVTGCAAGSVARTVTVNQNATISLSSVAGSGAQTLCINNAITDITYAIGGGGTGANLTGTLPAGVTGSYNAGVFTITGTPAQSGTFNYTVTTTGPCVKPALSGSITVQANSTISLSSAAGTDVQTKCINTAITNITYAIGGGATGATLTGTLPAGVSGSFNAGVFTISGTATATGSFSYTVTTDGPCVNDLRTGTITIAPNATISLSSAPGTNAQLVCANTAISSITYAVGAGGTGAGVTGLPAGITGLFNAGVFTISGTAAVSGTFNYTVTTTGTCTQASANGTITVSAPITATFTTTNVSACGGSADATITVTPATGTAPYVYSWTGMTGVGAHTPFTAGNVSGLTGLDIGYYDVIFTDANGCSGTITGIHIQYAFSAFVTNNGSISSGCANTGSIILYANAGIQPYTFSLDGITYQSNNTFLNLAAGNYTAYVKDGGGCVATKSIFIAAAPPVVVNPYVRPATSCSNDGSIEIYRTGGIPPYQYSLNGTNYQVGNVYNNLPAGPYTCYVKDSKGCIGVTAVTVTQGASLGVTVSKTLVSTCQNDGSMQATASGGTAPFTYSLDDVTYQPGNSFSGLAAGNYTVWVKDSKGCKGFRNVTLNLNLIGVTYNVTAAGSCASTNGVIQLFRTGGVGPYTYSIDGNTYQSSSTFSNLAPGTYDGFVKDSKTCIGATSNIVVGPEGCSGPIAGNLKGNKNTASNSVKIAANSVLKISAYPNPSASSFKLILEGGSKEKVVITVSDLSGRKLYQAAGELQKQYNFGNEFIPGMYLLQVVQGSNKQTIKLVKE